MHYLLKTEASTYSFADLQKEKSTIWDGVTNPVAVRNLREMPKDAHLVIYHTGDEKQAVGLAVATSDPHPDPKLKDPKRLVVDLEAQRLLPKPVSLAQAKEDPVLKKTDLARLPRLSIIPFTEAQFQRLLKLAGA